MTTARAGLYVLVAIVLTGCGRMSPERSAHVKITTADGRSLYLNRLARGVDYDVMWISVSDRTCSTPSESMDIVLSGQAGYPLYYRSERDGSFLLFLQGQVTVPKGFPVAMKQENVHPANWPDIEKRYALGEIRRVSVALPASDGCFVRW
jgi:hypothetical protein